MAVEVQVNKQVHIGQDLPQTHGGERRVRQKMFQHVGLQVCLENTITGLNQGNLPPQKDTSFDTDENVYIYICSGLYKWKARV